MGKRTLDSVARRWPAFALLVALILCFADVGEAIAERKWFQATSETFVVTSDDGEKGARRTARHFVLIHRVFQAAFPSLVPGKQVQVPVLAVRGKKSMGEVLGDPERESAGAMRTSATRRDILIRSDLVGRSSFSTVYHEYVHLVLRHNAPHLPLWLNEGLAQVWEDLEVGGDGKAKVARPPKHHLERLRNRPFVPMVDVLRADHQSDLYVDEDRRAAFYSQAWALTHYLLAGEGRQKYPAALERYADRVGKGADPVEEAERLLGDLDAIQESVRRHVRRQALPYLIYQLPDLDEGEIQVRRLSEGEALATLGEFVLAGDRPAAARELFEDALEASPDIAIAHQGLGILAARRSDATEAAERFDRAVELDPGLWVSHFGRSNTLGWSWPARAELEEALMRAVELNPRAAPVLCRLGMVYGQSRERLAGGLEMVRRAAAIEPAALSYRLAETVLLARSGARDAASETLNRLVRQARTSQDPSANNNICRYGALAGLADQVLPACDLACSQDASSYSERDSRGLARALAGDTEGAIEDFRFVLESAAPSEVEESRSEWLRILEEGGNPFDAETLDRLRRERPPC